MKKKIVQISMCEYAGYLYSQYLDDEGNVWQRLSGLATGDDWQKIEIPNLDK
jgi:hypothetical protein